MKYVINIIFTAFLCSGVFAQSFVTREQILQELQWLRVKQEAENPSFYRYTSRETIDSVFRSIEEICMQDTNTYIDAYWLPSLLSQYNYFFDVHTTVWPDQVKFKTSRRFPPVLCNEKNELFLPDSKIRITKINGIKLDTLAAWFFQFWGKELNPRGAYILWTLSPRFEWCLDLHGVYPPYVVTGKTETDKDTVVISEGVTEAEGLEKRCQIAEKHYAYLSSEAGDIFTGGMFPLKFQIFSEESIAVIRYNRVFELEDYPEVDSLIYHFFQECKLKKIHYLFLDVSRNDGGVLVGFDEVFGPYLRFKKKRTYEHLYYSVNGRSDKEDMRMKNVKKKGGMSFNGQIFVYQSYYTGSAASIICALMKVTADAVLVGTETSQGIPLTAGFERYHFPYSKGYTCVPSIYRFAENPQLKRDVNGYLLPDIPYPFLTDRRLGVEDCQKIISLKNNNK